MALLRQLLIALLSLLWVSPANAEYTQTAKVRYQTNYSYSQWYTVDVTFVTGSELNRATSSFRYGGFEKYAVVFWGPGEASVIELDGFFVCSFEFTRSCLSTITSRHKGVDQEGRQWEVCTGQFCF